MGKTLHYIKGTIGDETGCADFRLNINHVKDLKEGITVAFRNGKCIMNDNKILLEVDRFGKISVEDAEHVLSINEEFNISRT